MEIKTIEERNSLGPKITIEIQLRFDEFLTSELPESCTNCPIGFSAKNNCGRNIPLKMDDYAKRPDTCKLKQLNLSLENIIEMSELPCLII
jgi:hypothetical protein